MFKPGQFQGKQSKLPRFLFHYENNAKAASTVERWGI